MWRNQLAPLSAAGIEVLPLDLPAHGARMAEPFSVDAAFAAVDAALNPGADQPGEPADRAVPRLLVGLSLGQQLARRPFQRFQPSHALPLDVLLHLDLLKGVGEAAIVGADVRLGPHQHPPRLVALTWLGRGDGDIENWDELRAEAARAHNKRTATYLLGMPMLADHLEEALSKFGHSSEEVEEIL